MIPPCITINEKLLNPLRTLIIHKMYNEGLSQNEIAKKLKISQVSVNRYLRKDPEEVRLKIIKLGLDSNKLDVYIKNILNDIYSNSDSFTLCLMCKELRLHEFYFGNDLDIIKYLNNEKNVHEYFSEFNTLISPDMLEILSELNRAAHKLENIYKFSKIIPTYGSDFIFSLPKPYLINEIAGLPSRIINYHRKPRIFIGPEFGYNSEISNLLIKISNYNPKIRSGISLGNDDNFLLIIKKYYTKNFINLEDIEKSNIDSDFIFINKNSNFKDLPMIFLFSTNPDRIIDIIIEILKYY